MSSSKSRLFMIALCALIAKNTLSFAPNSISRPSCLGREAQNVRNEVVSISTCETANLQLGRLFGEEHCSMSRWERLTRIGTGWVLLLVAKSISLISPLLFRNLIQSDSAMIGENFRASILGLVMGLGVSRVSSGFVQLVCEVILSPATTSAAEILPKSAFEAALASAGRRQESTPASRSQEQLRGKLSGAGAGAGASVVGHDEGQSGFARRALDRGLKASNQFLYRIIFNLLPSFVEAVSVLVFLFIKTGKYVGFTAAAVSILYVLATTTIMSMRIPILRNVLKCEGTVNGCAEDALALAEVVAAFGTEGIERERYTMALEGVTKSNLKVRHSFSVLKFYQSVILGVGTAAVAYAAWKSVETGHRSGYSSQLILVNSLFAQLIAPLDHVGQHFRDCVSAAEDLRELENLRLQCADHADHVLPANQTEILRGHDASPVPVMSCPPKLELRNITFTYSGLQRIGGSRSTMDAKEKYLLRNVSLTIPAGGYSVGLVGPSGSGKSTLLRILVGIEQIISSDGDSRIFVDGVDVTCSRRSFLFAMAGQENDLFRSMSLADNVIYGTHGVLDVALVGSEEAQLALGQAVTDAQLESVAARLRGGWAAEVGPRGRALSGGERQRVCVARALYREALGGGILLMDEVTSSLDAKTESAIMRAVFNRVKSGSTVLLIAHRLASVQECDLILVMQDGEIVESGSHEQLVNMRGWYSEAWSLQTRTANMGL